MFEGVAVVWEPARGVIAPLLFWVARREASRRESSDIICVTVLLRRWEGLQSELKNGAGRSV